MNLLVVFEHLKMDDLVGLLVTTLESDNYGTSRAFISRDSYFTVLGFDVALCGPVASTLGVVQLFEVLYGQHIIF